MSHKYIRYVHDFSPYLIGLFSLWDLTDEMGCSFAFLLTRLELYSIPQSKPPRWQDNFLNGWTFLLERPKSKIDDDFEVFFDNLFSDPHCVSLSFSDKRLFLGV